MGLKYWIPLALAIGVSFPASPADAQSPWDRQKGNCESVFASYQQAGLPELKYCMGLWEAYKDVGSLDDAGRAAMAPVFRRLYGEGDAETRFMAKNALSRLGFTPRAEDEKKLEAEKRLKDQPKRKRYRPHRASKHDRKAAKRIRAKAFSLYRKGDYDGALGLLAQALDLDPGNVQVLYDSACCYALIGRKSDASEYLQRLADIGTKPALKKLRRARTDKDFQGMRDDPGYKRTSGYARIKVLNGMPADDQELGEDNVYVLVELLSDPKLAYRVEDGGKDKHARDRPHIWYKEPSKLQAYVIRKLLGNPRTRLVPIDWDSKFDIIVSWADSVVVDEYGERKSRYTLTGGKLDPEKQLDQALKDQNDALSKPDQYISKADKVINSADASLNKVESVGSKVESTTRKVKGVVDKVKGMF
ncbi:MAG: tetratricopeptide repeat protein [Deltaproteobacteria bacterium]|nr:tetratricopeptide repeat protein [Deltaproteobacteria bacterium]